jgi:drug/metabolite transporter (DMT)-like permease
MPTAAPVWRVWLSLGTVYVVWGSTYLAIRVMVRTVPPLLSSGVRFLIAGALLAGWVRLRGGRAATRASAGQLGAAALAGTLLVAGGNGLVSVAERHVPSGLAGLIMASIPLWVVLLRLVLARERTRSLTLAGVAVGFTGVGILLLPGGRPAGAAVGGIIILLVAALCWASGSFTAGRRALPQNLLYASGVQMLAGGAASGLLGIATGELADVHPDRVSGASLAAFAYLVVVGSLVAFTAYAYALQHAPISKVSTYAFVNPVIAVALGWAILGEDVRPAMLAGAAIIVVSVASIVRGEKPRAPRAEPGAQVSAANPAA